MQPVTSATPSPSLSRREVIETSVIVPEVSAYRGNYEDRASFSAAVKDIEGVFVISANDTSEEATMPNLVAALNKENKIAQVIRMLGIFLELSPSRIPLNPSARSLPVQHPIAKLILDESGLPVTYIDSGAELLSSITSGCRSAPYLAKKTLIWPEQGAI